MQEIGIGLVNAQAAEIDKLLYPDWASDLSWSVQATGEKDDDGYDLYQLDRQSQSIIVPANRLVFMERMLERMR